MSTAVAEAPHPTKQPLVTRVAQKFGVDPDKMLNTLKLTAFKSKDPVTNEQMMALLVVADQYNLNPWTREIYAFPDKGGIVPVVGIDGWSRIINSHPQFDGMDFVDGPDDEKHKGAPQWIECIMHRKDRAHPTKVRERMSECWRDTTPWASHPARMLRHKAMIQCARVAFGFVGIYDEDEAQRIIQGESVRVPESAAVASINAAVTGKKPEVIDVESTHVAGSQPAKTEVLMNNGITFAKLIEQMQKRTEPDVLDADADLIRHLPENQQKDARIFYKQRRDEIDGAQTVAA